jgi:hypothetical protein
MWQLLVKISGDLTPSNSIILAPRFVEKKRETTCAKVGFPQHLVTQGTLVDHLKVVKFKWS